MSGVTKELIGSPGASLMSANEINEMTNNIGIICKTRFIIVRIILYLLPFS
ncbi:hypothetical protein FM106_27195 [Brachybacterium faecium]|nr:hypothetical protein FM106_27195 [Brachybacterium faecium]